MVRRRLFPELHFPEGCEMWQADHSAPGAGNVVPPIESSRCSTLFLCGDVMTGRGIDQILPHPSDPRLYERYLKSAGGYVELAEAKSGRIARPVDFSYIWGDALLELERRRPDARIINLETAVTTSGSPWKGKGIHYRMRPENIGCIVAAGVDCCSLANNHVLDWGRSGLLQTLEALKESGIGYAGAGRDLREAAAPAVIDSAGKGRVLVFSFGTEDSGILPSWAATTERPGVNVLEDLSAPTIRRVADQINDARRPEDLVVASIHWGGNWGYEISSAQIGFAHALIDEAGVDVVHGHSSHHPKGIDIHAGRPILYGCGDFINDYEGIGAFEDFRDDLALMYFVSFDRATRRLARFEMVPARIRRFRSNRASRKESRWLQKLLSRESETFGNSVELLENDTLLLSWN